MSPLGAPRSPVPALDLKLEKFIQCPKDRRPPISTWQKRGHTSLNGVVTAVSVDTGKVADAEILSRKCSCHFSGNLHSDECSANYFGNSGGMEVEGALRIFNRSELLHNLRYTQYLGDGDSKACKAVLES
ncbi:uncharacterized protein TNCV_4699851 [Trichonephila clavipes]|nr:uncharacterized protein TNCV_4699851 [Trichonephila clavipes]